MLGPSFAIRSIRSSPNSLSSSNLDITAERPYFRSRSAILCRSKRVRVADMQSSTHCQQVPGDPCFHTTATLTTVESGARMKEVAGFVEDFSEFLLHSGRAESTVWLEPFPVHNLPCFAVPDAVEMGRAYCLQKNVPHWISPIGTRGGTRAWTASSSVRFDQDRVQVSKREL